VALGRFRCSFLSPLSLQMFSRISRAWLVFFWSVFAFFLLCGAGCGVTRFDPWFPLDRPLSSAPAHLCFLFVTSVGRPWFDDYFPPQISQLPWSGLSPPFYCGRVPPRVRSILLRGVVFLFLRRIAAFFFFRALPRICFWAEPPNFFFLCSSMTFFSPSL